MIPFDIDSFGYCLTAVCLFIFVVSAIAFVAGTPNFKLMSGIFACVFLILGIVVALVFIVGGSTYTDTITICAHTSDHGYMTVIDTNQNIYYVNDLLTQFKVKDNTTVEVKSKRYLWGGEKIIYSIGAPIACGNQICGVSA